MRESASISVPITVGQISPAILLPTGWREWDPAKLRAVLAHEEAHVRRADWAIGAMARRVNPPRPPAHTLAFGTGYLAVWAIFRLNRSVKIGPSTSVKTPMKEPIVKTIPMMPLLKLQRYSHSAARIF